MNTDAENRTHPICKQWFAIWCHAARRASQLSSSSQVIAVTSALAAIHSFLSVSVFIRVHPWFELSRTGVAGADHAAGAEAVGGALGGDFIGHLLPEIPERGVKLSQTPEAQSLIYTTSADLDLLFFAS